jgi:hypothetical protein
MKKIDRFLDFHLQEVNLIYAFWTMFWLLNGLDKFFIGVGADASATCSFSDGRSTPCGWFGVDRTMQMQGYFGKLMLPDWLGAITLNFLAVAEIALGVAFAWMLLRSLMASEKTTHVVHRMAFKGSFLMFFLFSAGDILFGDRRELWEHGTFLILVIITYRIYVDRNQLRSAVVRDLDRSETFKRPAIRDARDSVMYRREMVDDEEP